MCGTVIHLRDFAWAPFQSESFRLPFEDYLSAETGHKQDTKQKIEKHDNINPNISVIICQHKQLCPKNKRVVFVSGFLTQISDIVKTTSIKKVGHLQSSQ